MKNALRRTLILSCTVALLAPYALAAGQNPNPVRGSLLAVSGEKELPRLTAVTGQDVTHQGSIGCKLDLDLNYVPIGIPWVIGIGEEVDGTATVHCLGHAPVTYSVSGGGLAPSLMPVTGSKSYRGISIRLPAPFIPAHVEGDYFYIGINSIVGGVQVSPWVNRSVEFRVEFQLPLQSNSLVGVNLTKLTFRRN